MRTVSALEGVRDVSPFSCLQAGWLLLQCVRCTSAQNRQCNKPWNSQAASKGEALRMHVRRTSQTHTGANRKRGDGMRHVRVEECVCIADVWCARATVNIGSRRVVIISTCMHAQHKYPTGRLQVSNGCRSVKHSNASSVCMLHAKRHASMAQTSNRRVSEWVVSARK